MNVSQSLVRNFNIAIKAPKDVALRIKLIQEESQELIEAIAEKNVIDVIDALCDLLYVVYGAADVFNIELDEIDFSSMNIGKEPRWDLMGNPQVLRDFNYAVNDAIISLRIFQQFNATGKLKSELGDLAKGCWEFGAGGVGVDLRQFFREVHRTNMHKLTGPQREDGKQLKPEGWKPPRIKEMYDRVKEGKNPQCDTTCEARDLGAYRFSPHPEGGYRCMDCGGLVVDVGT